MKDYPRLSYDIQRFPVKRDMIDKSTHRGRVASTRLPNVKVNPLSPSCWSLSSDGKRQSINNHRIHRCFKSERNEMNDLAPSCSTGATVRMCTWRADSSCYEVLSPASIAHHRDSNCCQLLQQANASRQYQKSHLHQKKQNEDLTDDPVWTRMMGSLEQEKSETGAGPKMLEEKAFEVDTEEELLRCSTRSPPCPTEQHYLSPVSGATRTEIALFGDAALDAVLLPLEQSTAPCCSRSSASYDNQEQSLESLKNNEENDVMADLELEYRDHVWGFFYEVTGGEVYQGTSTSPGHY